MAKHLTYLTAALLAALTVTTGASYAAAPVVVIEPAAVATVTTDATAQTVWQAAWQTQRPQVVTRKQDMKATYFNRLGGDPTRVKNWPARWRNMPTADCCRRSNI